jgi:chromosome segregation ATPase
VKNNSSHAEVLRRENEKQKTNNKNDKSNFEKDTKKWEEREFQLVTALKKLNFDFTQLQKLLKERDEEIDGLKHSITSYVHSAEFHQKELKQVQEKAKVVDHKNVTLETGYEQMRNNVESEKIFLSYELEDLKKKFREAEFAVREYQEKNESLELRYKKLEEVHRVGLEEDQIKSATLTNQEEIIGEQHRIIAELKITLEADRKKLRSLERPHDSLNFKSSSQEDDRLRLKGEVGASDEYSRGRHFEELSASFQVLSSQKSVLERDIRQVRLMNE